MDNTQSLKFNAQDTTCENVDLALSKQNVLLESDTCSSFQEMYSSTCCYDECQLCEIDNNEFLDLRVDHLVEQGGYSATCGEVNTILSASAESDKICFDARAQLTEECCYKQCNICDISDDITNDWYATVNFEGVTTSCLGLDYMLRMEQVNLGSDRCSAVQGEYFEECCYKTPSKQCQICEADDVLYEILATKTVSYERDSTTATCAKISDSFLRMESDDQNCIEGKQSLFGKCCDLTSVVVLQNAPDGNPAARPNQAPGAPTISPGPNAGKPSAKGEGWWKATLSPTTSSFTFNWDPPSSALNVGPGLASFVNFTVWFVAYFFFL